MLEYRNVNDLNRLIIDKQDLFPKNIDLVVGIPRSGLLFANLVALHLNLPLADLEGFLEGRILSGGQRNQEKLAQIKKKNKVRVMVLDDSLYSGQAMEDARNRLSNISQQYELVFGVAYLTHLPEKDVLIDFYLEKTFNRIFEWNTVSTPLLKFACVDIDGVLCRDPSEDENDDGEKYRQFLRTVPPRFIPSYPIGWLVTSRLEKYRKETEEWLHSNDIKYEQLIMLDLPSKEERIKQRCHASFKAGVYIKKRDAKIFIESDEKQAAEIANITKKPVISLNTSEIFYGVDVEKIRGKVRRTDRLHRIARKLPKPIKMILKAMRKIWKSVL